MKNNFFWASPMIIAEVNKPLKIRNLDVAVV